MAFTLSSPAFAEGAGIPKLYTCEGENHEPALVWDGAPSGTKSFALILHDPDAPRGDFTHWVLYDIDGGALSLPEGPGADAAGTPGKNSRGDFGYMGPCPPPGHGAHRYMFELYALDLDTLDLPDGATREQVETAMQGHILGAARTFGCFARTSADTPAASNQRF